MSTTLTKLTTANELSAMPDDGFRYELVKGDLIRMSPAGDEHGRVTMNLAGPLHQHVSVNRLGIVYAAETGFKIESDPDTVRAPDVAFVSNQRLQETGTPRSYRECAPDLAVEVLSPGDTVSGVEAKVAQWLQAGALMVWVLSPMLRAVTVYESLTEIEVFAESDELVGDSIVPGFRISVARIFSQD